MGVGAGLYMYVVVVKSIRPLSHLLMSSCTNGRPKPRRRPAATETIKAKFHYASWFEAGSKLVGDQLRTSYRNGIWHAVRSFATTCRRCFFVRQTRDLLAVRVRG